MTAAVTGSAVSLTAVQLSAIDLALASLLDDAEHSRAGTFRSPTQRNRFLAGRIALRQHISELTDEDPQALTAAYVCPSCRNHNSQDHGKPRYNLPNGTGAPGVSLSRSGDWCLLAASTDNSITGIGVDIEQRAAADFDGFPNVALTPNEHTHLADVHPELKVAFQTRLWVRKEAVLKALGTGLTLDPSSVDVSGIIPAIPGLEHGPEQWQLQDISPAAVGLPEDYTAALAIQRRTF